MEERTEHSQMVHNNPGYQGYNALEIRLDTQPILDKIEVFLRGFSISVRQNEVGKIITEKIKTGIPKANDRGVQSILSKLSAVFNPQIVQGNFDMVMYENYIAQMREELTYDIIVNAEEWEVMNEDIDCIIDTVMGAVEPFMSRLINNEERISYQQTMKISESNVVQSKGGSMFNVGQPQ